MITKPINCPHCGAYVTDANNLTHYVMPIGGIPCPRCGRTAIESSGPVW